MNKRKNLIFFAVGALILLLFCYFRLKPIFFQTVPYTYDQGRDFLQAQAIVRDHDLTLLGPTTGIPGLYHGVWWYYLLAIPYLFTGGSPTGFLMFLFLLALAQVVLFSWFLKKEFSEFPALLFSLLISLSSYFMMMSFFAISSIQNLPVILFLFYTTYRFLKKPSDLFVFLVFLSLGFAFESEVPFGLFLIPAYLLTVFLTRNHKRYFSPLKRVGFAFAGLIIPMVPRILFEIRHEFLQTKTVLAFFIHPVIHSPHSLRDRFLERFTIFSNYYLSLFPDRNIIVATIVGLVALVGFAIGFKKLQKYQKQFVVFILSTFISLFVLSLSYKDTFWANYFEGLPYFYALFIAIGVHALSHSRQKLLKYIPYALIGGILVYGIYLVAIDLTKKTVPNLGDLKEHVVTTKDILSHEKDGELCVRVYTPPVIPYTYRYLFDYYSSRIHSAPPGDSFVKGQCWFVIEAEPVTARLVEWRKLNIPRNSKLLEKKIISDNVHIELWERP